MVKVKLKDEDRRFFEMLANKFKEVPDSMKEHIVKAALCHYSSGDCWDYLNGESGLKKRQMQGFMELYGELVQDISEHMSYILYKALEEQ
jgi:hypothetical protein